MESINTTCPKKGDPIGASFFAAFFIILKTIAASL
jgi:hypothetical protein